MPSPTCHAVSLVHKAIDNLYSEIEAAEAAAKEYDADWLGGFQKVFRIGGRFAKKAETEPSIEEESPPASPGIGTQAKAWLNANLDRAKAVKQQIFGESQVAAISVAEDFPPESKSVFEKTVSDFYRQIAQVMGQHEKPGDQIAAGVNVAIDQAEAIQPTWEESWADAIAGRKDGVKNMLITGAKLTAAAAISVAAVGALLTPAGGALLALSIAEIGFDLTAWGVMSEVLGVATDAVFNHEQVENPFIREGTALLASLLLPNPAILAKNAAKGVAGITAETVVEKAAAKTEASQAKAAREAARKQLAKEDARLPGFLDRLGLDAMPQTSEELKAVYRKVARQHHPDLGGDKEVMAEVNRAFEVLSRRVENPKALIQDAEMAAERAKVAKAKARAAKKALSILKKPKEVQKLLKVLGLNELPTNPAQLQKAFERALFRVHMDGVDPKAVAQLKRAHEVLSYLFK